MVKLSGMNGAFKDFSPAIINQFYKKEIKKDFQLIINSSCAVVIFI